MSYFIFEHNTFGDEFTELPTEADVVKYLTNKYNKKHDFAEDAVIIKGERVRFETKVTTEVSIKVKNDI